MEPAQQKRQQLHHFTILVEHVVLRLRRDAVHSHQSTTDNVKTSLRRTLSRPFKVRKEPAEERTLDKKPIISTDAPRISSTRGKYLKATPKLSREIMANNLHQVEDYVRRTSGRVQYLEGLIELEHSTIGQVTEIKRQLKTAHRNLEKLHFERCPLLGNDVNTWVIGAMRLAWQAYRRMVKLEEKLRSLPVSLSDSDDWVGDYEKDSPVMIGIEMEPERKELSADTKAGAAEEAQVQRVQPVTYVPTGAKGARLSAHIPKAITIPTKERQLRHAETYRMSGALPSTERLPANPSLIRASPEIIPITSPRRLPRLITHGQGTAGDNCYDGAYDSDDSLYENRVRRHRAEQRKHWSVVEDLDPVQATLPKAEVEARLWEEEEEQAHILIEPDRQRQGSCDGATVTDLVMNGILDHDYLLPYLHHIKHHELRALKQWLVVNNYVTRSSGISRMEKVLHCIELLQTGNRYETIATIFSRTPRQVESSCREVMEGLLNLHGFTMIKARDQEMYTTVWGIWCRKYENPQNRHFFAEDYYGYHWTDIGKVMVTLNLYIGRWREQGKFALEGPSLNWGKFFDADGTGRFPRMDQPLRLQYSAISTVSSDITNDESEEEDYDDDDSSLYSGGAVQTI
jgi:adenosyl cobinamide kinase/adenosyl cobinamide phosphate guanylyltransferase